MCYYFVNKKHILYVYVFLWGNFFLVQNFQGESQQLNKNLYLNCISLEHSRRMKYIQRCTFSSYHGSFLMHPIADFHVRRQISLFLYLQKVWSSKKKIYAQLQTFPIPSIQEEMPSEVSPAIEVILLNRTYSYRYMRKFWLKGSFWLKLAAYSSALKMIINVAVNLNWTAFKINWNAIEFWLIRTNL